MITRNEHSHPASDRSLIPLRDAWSKLISRLEEFGPDIVVLVARKMPRLDEALGAKIARKWTAISDLAIPFMHEELAGRKVAIVDDFVNYGSTMLNAQRQVIQCGARETRMFALSHSSSPNVVPRTQISYALTPEDTYPEAKAHSGSIIDALNGIAKPFDLAFPVFSYRLGIIGSEFQSLYSFLVSEFGSKNVYNLSTPAGRRAGIYRITLFDGSTHEGLVKLRLYFDENSGLCSLVPIEIGPTLETNPSAPFCYESTEALWNGIEGLLKSMPANLDLWEGESQARALLYLRSMELGLTISARLFPGLSRVSVNPILEEDARWLFGTLIERISEKSTGPASMNKWDRLERKDMTEPNSTRAGLSPFALELTRQVDLPSKIQEQWPEAGLSHQDDYRKLLEALFNVLAEHVGALDPSHYAPTSPYPPEQVTSTPYMRLRFGLTYSDLKSLFATIVDADSDSEAAPKLVSLLIDHLIDEGVIVPTIGFAGGSFYRIYRKGEGSVRRSFTESIMYAFDRTEVALSRTRFAKILATLSYSKSLDLPVSPKSVERGNVAGFDSSPLDLNEDDASLRLLKSGWLREAKE